MLDGRYGSNSEVAPLERHFRFAPVNGHRQAALACPKSAKAGPSTMTVFGSRRKACGAGISSVVWVVRYGPSEKNGQTHASLSNSSLDVTIEPALCFPLHNHSTLGLSRG